MNVGKNIFKKDYLQFLGTYTKGAKEFLHGILPV